MRLIDADALLKDAETDKAIIDSLADIVDIRNLVITQPTIDAVEVVHGRWGQRKSGFVYFCSNCEYWTFQREAHEWHYCPNCGTQMDGIDHE